jgi:sulfide:quinone oxidoreductase
MQRRVSRRTFAKGSLAVLAGGIALERVYDFASESQAKAKIVIVGGGAAGITVAAHLADMLRHDDVTIIEPNAEHHYQPGYTLIAGGLMAPGEVVRPTKSLVPSDAKWLQDRVTELNPDSNYVLTAQNGKVPYDFLVLVPGGHMDFDQVQGISREDLGQGNVHCIYDHKGAAACRKAMLKLPEGKGGRVVFADTHTKVKCGGAPRKICYMTEHHLRKENAREKFQVEYFASQNEIMKPKVYGDRLVTLFKERHVAVSYLHRLKGVDVAAKKAVFEIHEEKKSAASPADGAGGTSAAKTEPARVTVDFEFLHYVPPMSAPAFVRQSALADQSKPGGWVPVDRETLVHTKYKNVISFGDVSGLPTSKTGAAIRMQAPVAAANLVSLMEGKEPRLKYNGYSACPIITEYGKVLMCEFGYDEKLLPTIPWLDPAVERGMWWTLKVHGLKPMYYHGMLKGWV